MKTRIITDDGEGEVTALCTKTHRHPRTALGSADGIAIGTSTDGPSTTYPIAVAINDGNEELQSSQWNVFSVEESKLIRKALKRAEREASR